MSPLVSVIIPTYNRAYCLASAIESVLGQTYPEVEVLVIDDGSSDDTESLMRSTYGQNPRVRYVRQPNGGVCAARNRGLQLVRGEYLAFLDSDDLWIPWKLELQVAAMTRFPELVMTWTDLEAMDAAGRQVAPRHLRRMYTAYQYFEKQPLFSGSASLAEVAPKLSTVVGDARMHWGHIYGQMLMGSLVHTSTVLLRRSYLERIGDFDDALRQGGEDYDFHARTCREGPVALLDVPSIRYQTGMKDQFITQSKNFVHFARNYLCTITKMLERDRDRITLPPYMIHAALAKAHAWIGEELYHAERRTEACHHLWLSLRLRPNQRRTWMLLGAALLPGPMVQMARKAYRWLRRG